MYLKRICSFAVLICYVTSIDTGCTAIKPYLCPRSVSVDKPVCRKSYEECDAFEGCTDSSRPYLCSNGECAMNFSECREKFISCDNLE